MTYGTANDLGKSGLLYCLLGCFMPCIPTLLLRQEARERYNIEVRMMEMFVIYNFTMLLHARVAL